MAEIVLTNGLKCQIYDDRYEDLSQFSWCPVKRTDTITYTSTWKVGLMHRYLMNAEKGQWVDHINGNGLDNRLKNLRFCTPAENQANRKKRSDSTSKYKGIYWRSARNTWVATIQIDGRTKYLGSSQDEEQAAKMYQDAAEEFFGEFAWRGHT